MKCVPPNSTHAEEETPPNDAFVVANDISNRETVLLSNSNSSFISFGQSHVMNGHPVHDPDFFVSGHGPGRHE